MTREQRPILLGALALVVLLLAALWSTGRLMDQRAAAAQATSALAESRRLAEQIEQLRGKDALATAPGDTGAQEQALAQRVSEAAATAGLAGNWLQGIDHKPAQRVGDSPYLRKPAVLLTRGLTLTELTTLLYELTYDSSFAALELRLRTPPGEWSGNRWDADVTLSYLIYAPPVSPNGR